MQLRELVGKIPVTCPHLGGGKRINNPLVDLQPMNYNMNITVRDKRETNKSSEQLTRGPQNYVRAVM